MVLPISREDLVTFAPDRPNRNYSWTSGEQQQVTPYTSQTLRAAAFLAASGAVVGGFHVAQQYGYNPWNTIYKGVRTIEEMSPGKVFRTFQTGNFLSQFTDQGSQAIDLSAEFIKKNRSSAFFEDLVHRTGSNALSALDTGLQFKNNTLYAGDKVLLENARRVTSVGNPYFSAAYSRAAGFRGLPNVELPGHFNLKVPIPGAPEFSESIYFTGGSSKLQAGLNQAKAFAAESVERANRLANAPFGVEPFTTGLKGIQSFWEKNFGTNFTLAVESGSATQTLGRMGLKWGAIGTAAVLGYQTVDWATRNTDVLNGTIFDQGLTAGIATLGVKANIAAAKIADFIPGVRSYKDAQEELAPGSTSLLKLSAFPLTGALVGGSAYYVSGLFERKKYVQELMKEGLSYTQALPLAETRWLENTTSFVQENPITKSIEKRFGKKILFFGKISRPKGFALLGALALTVPVLPFLPGAIIPDKTSEELERIYSGEDEVAVRKGRFWELGRTPYEGGKIEYFRPHWFPRLLQGSYRKSMYGEDEPSPIFQWFKENFTSQMEREHYRDRPYPITGTAFEDIPILGPLLGATIGRIIKPPQLMHADEWTGEGLKKGGTLAEQQLFNELKDNSSFNDLTREGQVLRTPGRLGEIPDQPGDLSRGVPVNPNSLRQVAGEQAYRLSELSGLVGFSLSSIKGMITGEEEFFDQEESLQSARRMYGAERSFWDLNMGGAAFTNELFRRLLPHRRRQIEEYNPIRNTMPEWLPGSGDRSADFLHGDPFIKIQEGELRLPGEGYAARFPELEGVHPKDYPLIHQFKILSDIAPYSQKTKILSAQLMSQAKLGQLSDYELGLFKQTREQQSQKKETKSFFDYEVLSDDPDVSLPSSLGIQQSRSTVAQLNNILSNKRDEKISTGKTLIGGYWEGMSRVLQNPLEALSPLAPGSKLLNMKSSLDDYKQTQIYGPDIAFWQSPVDNFLLPFAREVGNIFTDIDVPEEVQKKRGIEEYFDILEYVKNKRLGDKAREIGATDVSGAYDRIARETSVGINPYTRDYSGLFRSMPRNERDYFSSFSSAKSLEEREEILSLVPANMRRIYTAQWEQSYADTVKSAIDRGLLSGDALTDGQRDLESFYTRKDAQGFPVSPELLSQYRSQSTDQSYGDWFRDAVLIPGIVGEEGLPGPDWVGWHPAIDLEEVKLKVVKNEGMDMHDLNLWPSDERSAARKPYLDDVAEELVTTVIQNEDRSVQQVQEEVRKILSELGIGSEAQVFVYQVPDETEQVRISIESSEIRNSEIRQILSDKVNELG
jgi:hypothetical protein